MSAVRLGFQIFLGPTRTGQWLAAAYQVKSGDLQCLESDNDRNVAGNRPALDDRDPCEVGFGLFNRVEQEK